MLKTTKRTLLVAIAAATVAAPSAASARIYPYRSHDQSSGAGGGEIVSQAGIVQAPANGFDWGDAGVGAAASALLLGGGGIAAGRRRSIRRAVMG